MFQVPLFPGIDPWDLTLGVVVSYLAVISLVRLMNEHRGKLVAHFRAQMELEKRRLAAEEDKRKLLEAAAAAQSKAGRGTAA